MWRGRRRRAAAALDCVALLFATRSATASSLFAEGLQCEPSLVRGEQQCSVGDPPHSSPLDAARSTVCGDRRRVHLVPTEWEACVQRRAADAVLGSSATSSGNDRRCVGKGQR